ncbi:MAG: hypothetical protein KDA91_09205 [Planctomycetaceae bacterium]|nr:hypothetical protein [Planctomycetaceae bacterium]
MTSAPHIPSRPHGWIIGPWVDSVFIANLFWPLLLLLQHEHGFEGRQAVEFWQIYFITTPHRWITMVLVLLDHRYYRQQSRAFLWIAVLVVGVCAGVRVLTGTLTCLLAVDYVWNAWHFASQHHGIYRIYTRVNRNFPASTLALQMQKWFLRGFLLYVTLRVATSTFADIAIEEVTMQLDWWVMLMPAYLLMSEFRTSNHNSLGRRLYLISVLGIYSSLLWSVHTHRGALTLILATASAWFHASEYMSVIGWHIQKRATTGDDVPLLAWLASRWIVAMLVFVVVLGSCSWVLEHQFLETWLTINVIIAFLHYGYDGFIWKSRRVTGGVGRPVQQVST